jgi:hypothetical protein
MEKKILLFNILFHIKYKFDILKAKKRFPDSGKACVLKRKVAKMRFLPKTTPFEVKMCGKSEIDIDKISQIQEKLYIDAKIRENNVFWSKNNAFSYIHLGKNFLIFI